MKQEESSRKSSPQYGLGTSLSDLIFFFYSLRSCRYCVFNWRDGIFIVLVEFNFDSLIKFRDLHDSDLSENSLFIATAS